MVHCDIMDDYNDYITPLEMKMISFFNRKTVPLGVSFEEGTYRTGPVFPVSYMMMMVQNLDCHEDSHVFDTCTPMHSLTSGATFRPYLVDKCSIHFAII